MRAYRLSTNLKLGLVLFAVVIAVASLVYTQRLVDRLREREQFIIYLWASALEQLGQSQSINPYQNTFLELEDLLSDGAAGAIPASRQDSFRLALRWARSMPPASNIGVVTDTLLRRAPDFGIPAIITDASQRQALIWHNVPIPDTLRGLGPEDSARFVGRLEALLADMDESYPPIPIEQDFGDAQLIQFVHYDESQLIKELRVFPYVQLLFVGGFILIGYLGFSYVRRSEQRSLWVGMAKEAAHQLGTPISSLMGWTALLKMPDLPAEQEQEAVHEIENDIDRLRRVANRFSDIGSLPKLEVMPLAPVVEQTARYIRRRIPQQGKRVMLDVTVPDDLRAPLNAELFEWVIENLLKNALDAIEAEAGHITIEARRQEARLQIDVQDTGKGIDRRQWKNVFRPGYSTKKRGWGLGLSLAKRIVEDYHGGTLALHQSRVGQGTTFRIELPAG